MMAESTRVVQPLCNGRGFRQGCVQGASSLALDCSAVGNPGSCRLVLRGP